MCYNACEFFHFNPMTGTDRCSLPKNDTCPQEPEEEGEAEEEEEDEETEDSPGT
jgi:hypothetical protein